jgi:hypothetical protein
MIYSFICIIRKEKKTKNMIPRFESAKVRCYIQITFLTLLLLFGSFIVASGQKRREEPPPLKERLFFGGNLGLQFGSITDIQVSPVVGLWVLPRLAVAVGPEYWFFKYQDFKTSVYGGKAYLQYVVIQDLNSIIPLGAHTGIFLHLEDEMLSLESSYWKTQPYTSNRFMVNTILAGGGISQQLGRRASVNIMVLWALNEPVYDLYSNPELRVSFSF